MALQYYNWLFFKSEKIADWAEGHGLDLGTQSVPDFFFLCLKLAKQNPSDEKYKCFVKNMWKHGKKRLSIGLQVDVDNGRFTSPHIIHTLGKSSFTDETGASIPYTQIRRITSIPEKPKYNKHNIQVGMKLRLVNKRYTGNVYTVTAVHSKGFDAKNGQFVFKMLEYSSIDRILSETNDDDSDLESAFSEESEDDSEEDSNHGDVLPEPRVTRKQLDEYFETQAERDSILDGIFKAYQGWEMSMCQWKLFSNPDDHWRLQKWLLSDAYGDENAEATLLLDQVDKIRRCRPKTKIEPDLSIKNAIGNKENTIITYGDFQIAIDKDRMIMLTQWEHNKIHFDPLVKNVKTSQKRNDAIALAAIKYAGINYINSTRKDNKTIGKSEFMQKHAAFYSQLYQLGVTIQGFSSPFDFYFSLPDKKNMYQRFQYCSVFESDKALGSLGTFFDYDFKQTDLAVLLECQNLTHTLMEQVVDKCIDDIKHTENDLVFVIFMPTNWEHFKYGKLIGHELDPDPIKGYVGFMPSFNETKFGCNVVILWNSQYYDVANSLDEFIKEYVKS